MPTNKSASKTHPQFHCTQGTWKLHSAEDVFAALEDNSVALSSMKASKFFLVFEKVRALAGFVHMHMLHWVSHTTCPVLTSVCSLRQTTLQEVTRWESTLAAVSEAVEVILQVQRSWMYLENIFGASEDIRKQLPSETALFEGVDATFVRAMRELKAAGNVVAATTRKGLLAAFQVCMGCVSGWGGAWVGVGGRILLAASHLGFRELAWIE